MAGRADVVRLVNMILQIITSIEVYPAPDAHVVVIWRMEVLIKLSVVLEHLVALLTPWVSCGIAVMLHEFSVAFEIAVAQLAVKRFVFWGVVGPRHLEQYQYVQSRVWWIAELFWQTVLSYNVMIENEHRNRLYEWITFACANVAKQNRLGHKDPRMFVLSYASHFSLACVCVPEATASRCAFHCGTSWKEQLGTGRCDLRSEVESKVWKNKYSGVDGLIH